MLQKLMKLGVGKKITIAVVGLAGIGSVLGMGNVSPTSSTFDASSSKTSQSLPAVKSATITKQTDTKTEEIPFQSSVVNDAALANGTTKIKTPGQNGVRTTTYEVTLQDGVETGRVLINSNVTTQPVNEVVTVGTYIAPVEPKPVAIPKPAATPVPATAASNCDPNYSPCIPNTSGNALNCPDIKVRVQVIGNDHNNFDGDGDGIGCESY